MSTSDDPKLYAVAGISQPIESVVRHAFPVLVETILLPFKIKSFMTVLSEHLAFIWDRECASLNSMKKTTGIIETLQQNPLA